MICLRESKEGTLLSVHAQPGASRNSIKGLHGEALKIAVQAPPVDGAANEALRDFLSEIFDLPASRIFLKAGATGRKKTFVLHGLLIGDAAKILEGKLP